jgi:hypothetical protein
MPKATNQFVLRTYCPKAPLSAEAFSALWNHLGSPPFAAKRYDQVERTRQPYSPASTENAYLLYRDSTVLVRGARALLMTKLAHPLEKVGIWTLWIDAPAIGTPASQERWLDWMATYFNQLPMYFGMGCTDSVFREKHLGVKKVNDEYLATDSGWRPDDFARSLPGVYWLNYYGPEISAELGSRIRSNENLSVRELDDGKLMATLMQPIIPEDLAERLCLERAIAMELGSEFFFDKDHPDAPRRHVPQLAMAMNQT